MLVIQGEDENRNPVTIEVSDTVCFWLYIINGINLVINLVGLLCVSLSILILYKRPLFHMNLVYMMTCGYFSGIFMTTCGILNSIACFLDFSILSEFLTLIIEYIPIKFKLFHRFIQRIISSWRLKEFGRGVQSRQYL